MGRKQSSETRDRISKALMGRKCPATSKWWKEHPEKRFKFTPEAVQKSIQTRAINHKTKTWEECSNDQKYNRVKEEQGTICNKCTLTEWMGLPIPLEIEHKDGNHLNNSRENLEAICPNCHAQTPTYKNKNRPDGYHLTPRMAQRKTQSAQT